MFGGIKKKENILIITIHFLPTLPSSLSFPSSHPFTTPDSGNMYTYIYIYIYIKMHASIYASIRTYERTSNSI